MKRSLIALVMVAAVAALAFDKHGHESLPNFDKRIAGPAPKRAATARGDNAIAELKQRVPHLEVSHSKILGRPEYFASHSSFLTGPAGEGLAVKAANGNPRNEPHGAVKAFLDEQSDLLGYGSGILKSASVRRDYVTDHNGLRTTVWHQELEGIPVFDGIIVSHVTRQGELVNLFTHAVGDPQGARGNGMKGAAAGKGLSAAQAIRIAAKNLGHDVNPGELKAQGEARGAKREQIFQAASALKGDQYAELTWLPLSGSAMRLCWRVIVVSKDLNAGYLILVDEQTGEVLLRRSLTSHISNASYNVYTSDSPSPFSPGHAAPSMTQPPLVPRVLITTNAFSTNASPNGWINDGDNETRGNNVDAHADHNDDDQPDLPRPQGNNRVFDFPLDLTDDPTNYTAAAVVNLFYWNNVIHDALYDLGFTEAAGNFQTDNFSRGGLGGDAVRANAQDGAAFKDIFHTDNANMFTPPDGIPPRMQMYVFSGPNPDRDGDLDSEVIVHEYVHGLSHRLVGNGRGISGQALQTHGMGEGWSDFYALALLSQPSDALNGNYPQGGYVTYDIGGSSFRENYYFGIRRYGYSTNLLVNPLTFKDIDPTQASLHPGIPRSPIFPSDPSWAPEVHNQGEVWCIALWEVRANLIGRHGWTNGNILAMQLVTDGMKLGPADPNFLQARDAILLADRVNNGGTNYFELWVAFAKRGMGGSATSPDSSTTVGVVEAYDMPGLTFVSAAVDDRAAGNGNLAVDYNECVDLVVTLRNDAIASVTGVVASITVTNPDVVVIQPSSAYPILPVAGTAQGVIPFRISTGSNFVCGTPIAIQLGVAAPFGTRTNLFWLETGQVASTPIYLNNSAQFDIPDANTNGVTSAINVSGQAAALGNVEVSVHLTHSAAMDLVLDLIAPDGTIVNLVRNQGGTNDNFGLSCSPLSARTTFSDSALAGITTGNAPFVGVFRPEQPLTTFKGKSGSALNGQWRLRAIDTVTNDFGRIECWTLALYPTLCADGGGICAADLAVSGISSPAPAIVGADLTYSISVTNRRSIAAPAVMLTNVLPVGVAFVSATGFGGACVLTNGVVVCPLGDVAGNGSAQVEIVVRPGAAGVVTNTFSVASGIADAVSANNSVTLLATVSRPRPAIVAGRVELTSESFTPASGGIESGETVTVNLWLHNTGTAPVTNLIGSLQAGNGVNSPSSAQSYGVIAPGGAAARSFTFTSSGSAGASILAILKLQDGVAALDDVVFTFGLGSSGTFANNAPITINELGAATPYPAAINVSGMPGVISRLAVTLSKVTHPWPDDLDVLLVGPQGQKLVLMSDAGGGTQLINQSVVIDSAGASALPDEASLVNGSPYLPANYEASDTFFSPAPAAPYASSFSAFNASNPNGTWSLYIMDDSGLDGGVVNVGWTLDIQTIIPVNPIANLGVVLTHPQPAVEGQVSTYTIQVMNAGPSVATNIIVSNTPAPLDFAIGTLATTHGTVEFAGGVIIGRIPSLGSGAVATITVGYHLNSTARSTNRVTVSSAVTDPDLANNSVVTVLSPLPSIGDLYLVVTNVTAPVFASSNLTLHVAVSNAGPGHAWGVAVTNQLPLGWTFVTATNSQGTTAIDGRRLVCTFGDITNGGTAFAQITLNASAAGVFTNLYRATLTTTDANHSNNIVQTVVTVSPRLPMLAAAGTAILNENSPADGGISAGETVTLNFALQNVGTRDTANLTATLQSSGGVAPVSGPVAYGALAANGAAVSRPCTFTANGVGEITATFLLQDGSEDLGAVTFRFPLAVTHSASSSSVIIIPQQGKATNYPATVTLAGLTGVVSKVTLSLNNLQHSFLADVDVLLVGPAGQKVIVMSDVANGASVNGLNLTFDDTAAATLPASGAVASGVYRPTNYLPGDTFPTPAPAGPFGSSLADFVGSNPNGTWSLYVYDAAAGDAGRINGGWTLNVSTVQPLPSAADVSIAASGPGMVEINSTVSYTLTVANNGPAVATGIIVTDTLPAGFMVTGFTASQGTVSTAAGSVTANVGSLNVGATAMIIISGQPTTMAALTNVVQVTSAQMDLVLANNRSVHVTGTMAPALNVQRLGSTVRISWAAAAAGFVLETSTTPNGPWAPAGISVTATGDRNEATVNTAGGAAGFYRLRKP